MASTENSFSKSVIKSRLVQKAAELWGYAESEIDAFDPLVVMLIEACAVELEKISTEINATESRLLERLAGLMNPDVIDAPRPAHAIMQARSRESIALLPTEAQFVYQRVAANRKAAGQSFFFSPLLPTKLIDGAVRYLATDNTLWAIEEAGLQKRVVARSAQPVPAEHRRLWIGLELNIPAHSLADAVFYFDWPNDPKRDTYLPYLPGESWQIGNQILGTGSGLPRTASSSDGLQGGELHSEFEPLQRLEQHVRTLYDRSFVHLLAPEHVLHSSYVLESYPALFALHFQPQELQQLTLPLLWLEVRFSHALPPEALATLTCSVNCFPVLNRRLNKHLYRLQQALNIFPLEAEESFLGMREVYSLNGVTYTPTTLTKLQEGATDTYILRHQGAGRFDARNGKQALLELIELLRDESRSFTATGTDYISNILRELNQNLARLEERVAQRTVDEAPVPYVMLRPQDVNDSVSIEHWTTNGESGNKIPAGSPLQVYDAYFVEEAVLLTTTVGGRERPQAEERVYAFRKNILSRNRIVTLEDIKAACWAELGTRIKQVQIEKAFRRGSTPEAGFARYIRVILTPTDPSLFTKAEWKHNTDALQAVLESQSAMNLPYEVSLASL